MNQVSNARQLFNHGDLPSAEAICQEILNTQPDSHDAYTLLGEIALRRNDLSKAEQFFQKALSINPNNPWDHVGLAGTYRRRGDNQAAIHAFNAALLINPNLSWPHVCLGDIFLEQNSFNDALIHYQQALHIDSHLILPKLGCGNAQLKLGNSQAARTHFSQVLEQDKANITAYLGLTNCALHEENWKDAMLIIQEALLLSPENQTLQGLLLDIQARSHGKNPATHLLQEADSAFARSDFELARLLYLQLRELQPDQAHPDCRLGIMTLQSGDVDQALTHFLDAKSRQEDYAWAHVGIGDCHSRKRNWQDAHKAYRRANELKPGNDYIASLLAKAENECRIIDETMAKLMEAADQAFSANDLELSATHYLQALELSPLSAHPYCRLGEIALKQDNPAQAVSYYSQAIPIQPDYVWAHYGLGQAYAALERYDDAIDSLKKANQLQPGHQYIADLIAELELEHLLKSATTALANETIAEAETLLSSAILLAPESEGLYGPVQALMEKRGIELSNLATHQIELEIQRLFLAGLPQLSRHACSAA